MCGIAGIINLDHSDRVDESNLRKMNQAQFHRGPDQGSEWAHANVGLAHRRLSIIDLSEAGRQPMFGADGHLVIVFNGEIYNFIQLREELVSKGYHFQTKTDTEVILNAWLEWQEGCLQHLRGMFAFCLYDLRKNVVLIARDRLGIKPLYYAQDDRGILFASELKAIEALRKEDLQLDARAIYDFFKLGYVPDPKSIYANVHKLLPGHYIKLDLVSRQVHTHRWWTIDMEDKRPVACEESLVDEFLEHFDEAVASHLIADVPLGAFLSGGVDSSSVVASMANVGVSDINTCSIGFDVEEYNETDYARAVALQYTTRHHEKIVNSSDISLVEKLIDVFDEPYADSSALPTYRVCEAAREHVTVCLSGDGGDELLGGYRRYRFHSAEESLRRIVPEMIRGPVFGLLGRVYPKLDWAPQVFRAKSTFKGLSKDAIDAYLNAVSHTGDEELRHLFSEDYMKKLDGYSTLEHFEQVAGSYHGKDALAQIQHIDFHTWLPGDILTKTDRTSMAHSLEVRVPFLDHKFVEWCTTLPSDYMLKQKQGKFILKKSMESRLPYDVLYRKKKGFDVPISEWFRHALVDVLKDKLLQGPLIETGIFNRDYISMLINNHVKGVSENKRILWSLLMFSEFIGKSR